MQYITPSPKTAFRRMSGLQTPPDLPATPSSPYSSGTRGGASSSRSAVDEAGGDEPEDLFDALAPESSAVFTTPRSDIRNLSGMSPEHLSFGDQDGEEDEDVDEDDEYIEHERAKRPTDRKDHLSPSPWSTSPAAATFPITPLPPTAASPLSFSPVASTQVCGRAVVCVRMCVCACLLLALSLEAAFSIGVSIFFFLFSFSIPAFPRMLACGVAHSKHRLRRRHRLRSLAFWKKPPKISTKNLSKIFSYWLHCKRRRRETNGP